jgi:hypothetical protein
LEHADSQENTARANGEAAGGHPFRSLLKNPSV